MGGGGGTQYGNTVRKIGKYRNTLSKMDEIPIPHPSCGNACPGGTPLFRLDGYVPLNKVWFSRF